MDNVDWDLVAADVGLLTLASLSIFAGAFGSLPVRANPSEGILTALTLIGPWYKVAEESPQPRRRRRTRGHTRASLI